MMGFHASLRGKVLILQGGAGRGGDRLGDRLGNQGTEGAPRIKYQLPSCAPLEQVPGPQAFLPHAALFHFPAPPLESLSP